MEIAKNVQSAKQCTAVATGSGSARCKTIGRWQPSIVLRASCWFSGASQRASASGKEDLAGVETAKSAGVSAQGWAVL